MLIKIYVHTFVRTSLQFGVAYFCAVKLEELPQI